MLTHVPPFREACWHRGQISDDDWLPHFACRAVGEVLVEAMAAHPECEMTVLCGHTHSPGEAQVLPNLRVLTGGAEYGRPAGAAGAGRRVSFSGGAVELIVPICNATSPSTWHNGQKVTISKHLGDGSP